MHDGCCIYSIDIMQGLDPNKPITEVFCCVDPAKYINSFDIGMSLYDCPD